MMTVARSWIKDNATLVSFLVAQVIAIGAVVLSLVSYMVRLETRVNTLEVRGSPHLNVIDNRLTVLENQTKSNRDSVERIISVMTRDINK